MRERRDDRASSKQARKRVHTLVSILAVAIVIPAFVIVIATGLRQCSHGPSFKKPSYKVDEFDIYMIELPHRRATGTIHAKLGAVVRLKNTGRWSTIRVEDLYYRGKVYVAGINRVSRIRAKAPAKVVGSSAAAPGERVRVPVEVNVDIAYADTRNPVRLHFPGTWFIKINGEAQALKLPYSFKGLVSQRSWRNLIKSPAMPLERPPRVPRVQPQITL